LTKVERQVILTYESVEKGDSQTDLWRQIEERVSRVDYV